MRRRYSGPRLPGRGAGGSAALRKHQHGVTKRVKQQQCCNSERLPSRRSRETEGQKRESRKSSWCRADLSFPRRGQRHCSLTRGVKRSRPADGLRVTGRQRHSSDSAGPRVTRAARRPCFLLTSAAELVLLEHRAHNTSVAAPPSWPPLPRGEQTGGKVTGKRCREDSGG